MADERLLDFPSKPVPVGADIVYLGNSANSFDEVQSTISQIFAGYSPALASLAQVSLGSAVNMIPYFSGNSVFSLTSLTSFARSILDDTSGSAVCTTIGALRLAGGTMTGDLQLYADPTLPFSAATKNYVDLVAQGLKIIGACTAGSTVNLNATYNNGASGVGATLTNAGTQAVFVIDGVTPVATNRILIKNQTNAFENGIYTLTNVGSISTNWILTRATDYDEPSEINPGDYVITNEGTINAELSWVQTATIVTIGTDDINFSPFGEAGNQFLKVQNNLSDLLSVPQAISNLGFVNALVKIGSVTVSSLVVTSGIISVGDTIPQNTSGTQVMSLSYTPLNSSNMLEIDVIVQTSCVDSAQVTAALFQDSIPSALCAGGCDGEDTGTRINTISFKKVIPAGTTSPITFKVRLGSSGGGNCYFNGQTGARSWGGVSGSSITVKEYTS